MVLDTYDQDRDVLIFKNTFDNPENGQPKKYEIARTDPNAPETFYFVHIEVRDMDSLPTQGEGIRGREQKFSFWVVATLTVIVAYIVLRFISL